LLFQPRSLQAVRLYLSKPALLARTEPPPVSSRVCKDQRCSTHQVNKGDVLQWSAEHVVTSLSVASITLPLGFGCTGNHDTSSRIESVLLALPKYSRDQLNSRAWAVTSTILGHERRIIFLMPLVTLQMSMPFSLQECVIPVSVNVDTDSYSLRFAARPGGPKSATDR